MNVPLRKTLSQDEFFAWAEAQDGRYEFNGSHPVGMVGGTMNHGALADNIRVELKLRLRGGPCRSVSPDGGGIETAGGRVRYPEATVTCSRFAGTDRIIPDPVVVFKVVSESTRRIDQVLKLREYHAVRSIKRYILVEQTGVALTVHARLRDEPWTTVVLGKGDVLALPEIGVEIPVVAIYDDVTFEGQEIAGAPNSELEGGFQSASPELRQMNEAAVRSLTPTKVSVTDAPPEPPG